MDNVIHHLNPLAIASVRLDPDAIWVGLNSDTSLIKDSTIIFKDLPDPGWSIEDFSDTGQIIPFDSVRDPDWYREDEQWAPWIPTSFLLTERPGTTTWKQQCQLRNVSADGVWHHTSEKPATPTSSKHKLAFAESSRGTSAFPSKQKCLSSFLHNACRRSTSPRNTSRSTQREPNGLYYKPSPSCPGG